MIVNRGTSPRESVNVGGKKVRLFSSGATTYDKKLANEIKDKYKDDWTVDVINKSHVRQQGADKTHHTVPALPWKDED